MRDRIGCGMRPEKLAPFDGETNFGRSPLHKRRKKATINREIIARNVVRVPFFRRTFWHIHPHGFCSILDFGKRCVPTHFDKFIFNFSRKKNPWDWKCPLPGAKIGSKKIPESCAFCRRENNARPRVKSSTPVRPCARFRLIFGGYHANQTLYSEPKSKWCVVSRPERASPPPFKKYFRLEWLSAPRNLSENLNTSTIRFVIIDCAAMTV
jgi:hypothetical protein